MKNNKNIAGLTAEEARKRIQKYGKNTISEVQPSPIVLFLRKFWGVIPWMLEASIFINLIIGKYADAILIIIILIFQAALGFYRESNAKRAISLLKNKLSISVRVKRDGKWQMLPSSEIVPDDYVHLQAGNIVPADIKIVDGFVLADQSQLTGESMPVEVNTGKVVYAGSLITQGEAYGIVSATGEKTYYGKTASLVRLVEHPPLLQRLALQIAKYLLVLDIALAIIAFIVLYSSGASIFSLLTFILMILVLSVPVALPAMSALSATLGAGELAKMGVLTTRLSAIEDAAAMDVLCIDKTGTLTENKPKVKKIFPFSKYSEDQILRLGACTVPSSSNDPLNQALLNLAKEKNLINDNNLPSQIVFQPFDPKTKTSGAWFLEDGKQIYVIKGEPSSVAKLTNTPYKKIANQVSILSQSGDRVIAVAINDDSKLKFAGLISLTDPIRPDSAELISLLKNKGVKVILLTGDNKNTAEEVAKQIGIEGDVAPDNIDYENISPEMVEKYAVFSRVLPQDKYYIVRALQKAGHVVGMTGDGVNDSPSLRQANVGIATANALDIAKSSAGIVLTKPGLSNITNMINVSRSIHQRLKTWISAMITRKLAVPIFIAFGLLIFKEPVISPFLAFIFMLFGDVVTFSLSKDNVVPSAKPDRWNLRSLIHYGSIYGLVLLLMSLAVFWVARDTMGLPLEQVQTAVFTWLVLSAGQAVLYVVRTRTVFWEKPYPGRWFAAASVLTILLAAAMATLGIFMQPIPLLWFGVLLIAAFGYMLICNGIYLVIEQEKGGMKK
jgi:H+-transporting ATPase